MSLDVGVKHTTRRQSTTVRLRSVLGEGGVSASTDRVLASGFWVPTPSTAPALPIDLAAARARR